MEEYSDLDAEFRVRLPSALAERIAEAAKKERRSRNLQYVFMLENWFELKENLEPRIAKLELLAAEEGDTLPAEGKKTGKRDVREAAG
jgi:hypothetical protein